MFEDELDIAKIFVNNKLKLSSGGGGYSDDWVDG